MDSLDKYGETMLRLSEFVQRLDERVRAEAFKFLLSQETHPPTSATVPSQTANQDRPIAPQELIRKTNASSFVEKGLALAYWLETYQQQETFSSGDLKLAFEQAREHSPKNPSDLVGKLESAMRIMKADRVGGVQRYRLTRTAIDEIQGRLEQELK